ncbi:MAG: HNH endonuclease [Pyrinomonadaceae bacterium]|nr:HNH endonuclease [Pyrinomonadaceae bacterium]
MLGFPHKPSEKAEKQYLALCEELRTTASGKSRTYWLITGATSSLRHRRSGGDTDFPDEVDRSGHYPEGAVKQILVNAYERNSAARQACIDHHGANCAICNFNFEACYGAVGRGFIHVHHLLPLALRNAAYEVDPINDLRPVCPNCHAMLHKSDPPFSIEEMRELMASSE